MVLNVDLHHSCIIFLSLLFVPSLRLLRIHSVFFCEFLTDLNLQKFEGLGIDENATPL